MITYQWRFTGVNDYPAEPEGVFYINWDLYGFDDKGKDGYIYGTVNIDAEKEWLPYNELTVEILVGWIKEALGPEQVEACEQSVADQIASK